MNAHLCDLLLNWQSSGFRPQEAFDWSAATLRWKKSFPSHAYFIESILPSKIDRTIVRDICESDEYDVIQKFLAVMIWGYGDRGYGAYRVGIMLAQPKSKVVLTNTYEIARAGNPRDAYKFLMENRIRNLGPAFGTKFLSFCTPREVGAPIYDSLVSSWIQLYASLDFESPLMSSEYWNLRTYSAYWDWIKKHSAHFGCYPDEVELAIFRDSEKVLAKSSKWPSK